MNQREYNDMSRNSQWLVEGDCRVLVGGVLWRYLYDGYGHRIVALPVFPEPPTIVWPYGKDGPWPEITENTVYYYKPVCVKTMGGDWPGYEVTVRRGNK